MTTKKITAKACVFAGGQFELGDNGDNAKTVPVKLVIRTGNVIDHPYWGPCVHDFDGMNLVKNRVALDWLHDDNALVGYANNFDTSTGNLCASGALVPFTPDPADKASEIIHKAKNGVPYESSLAFGGDGIVIENVPAGVTVPINTKCNIPDDHKQVSGPVTIFRNWPVRGVAICPHGADMYTSTQFSDQGDKEISISVLESKQMSEQTSTVEAKPAEAVAVETETTTPVQTAEGQPVEAEKTVPEKAKEPEAQKEAPADPAPETVQTAEVKPVEAVAVEAAVTTGDPHAELKRFMADFGSERGATWFASGMKYAEAQTQYCAALRSENESLKGENDKLRQMAQQMRGESEGVSFQQAVEPLGGLAGKRQAYAKKLEKQTDKSVAQLAARIAIKQ